jgi:L-lactate dehydrogenase (cytochrome)
VTPVCVADFRELARRRLPHFLFEYIDGGSYAEQTLRRNVEDLAAIGLRQRVLRDVSAIDLRTTFLGTDCAMPLALGPVGLAGMNARRGEVQAARAAEDAGIPFCLSTVSACSLAEVAAGAARPLWFQLYAIRDRGFLRDLLAQARALGCETLLLTVDLPMPGIRRRDFRSGLAGASGWRGGLRRLGQAVARPRWAWDVGVRGRPHALGNLAPVLGESSGLEDFMAWMSDNFDPSLAWRDLGWIRSEWPGTLLIKGVLDPADALEAAAAGLDGIVISNHGGRQLDGVPSTARALPPIAEALQGRLALLVDGGVRSGLDVVKMIALGAEGVLLGRAWAYALAAQGRAGVARLLNQLAGEMRIAMALTGVTSVAEIDRSILVTPAGQVD